MNLRNALLALAAAILFAGARAEALRPRVVVVAMFEPGKDTGDTPGELQFWVEREHLDRLIDLPGGFHGVRMDASGRLAAILVGQGTSNASASIMALGLDPRFDLSRTYWLVAGIAGISPSAGSIGSAAWAHYVVDGELIHEIDAREIPADWPDGHVALGASRPYEAPSAAGMLGDRNVFELDPGLVGWAYGLTRNVVLPDNGSMSSRRAAYAGYPMAQRPPFVLVGDNLSSSTYWHGRLMDAWAIKWVRFCTAGKGVYATTAMEDSGTLRALNRLSRAGKVDRARVLVLRTASNYDMQWPGASAADSMSGEKLGVYTAYLPSLEAAYRVGSPVVHALIDGWSRYETLPPSAPLP